MVKVREEHPIHEDGSINIAQWLNRLPVEVDVDKELLLQACKECQQFEQSSVNEVKNSWGEAFSCFSIGMEMVEILADLHLDTETLIAAVLYRLVREQKLALEVVEQSYG